MDNSMARIVEAWNDAYPSEQITAEQVIGLAEYEQGIQAVIDNGCKVFLGDEGLKLLVGPGAAPEPLLLEAPGLRDADADEGAPPPLTETPAPESTGGPEDPPPADADATDPAGDPPPPPEDPPADPPVDPEPKPDTYEVFKGKDGKSWFFHRKAGNGETVAQSESYKTRKAALEEAHKQADPAQLDVFVV